MTARLKTIFNLSEVEQNLLSDLCNAFHALDKKVIVVLNGVVLLKLLHGKSLPDAILLAWQPRSKEETL